MKLSQQQQDALCKLLEYEGETFNGTGVPGYYVVLAPRTVASLVKKGLVTFSEGNGPNEGNKLFYGTISITDKGLKAINDNAEPEEGDLVKYLRFERHPRVGEKVEWTYKGLGSEEHFTGRIEQETQVNSGIFFIAISTASVHIMSNETLYARVAKDQVRILPKV